MLKLPPIGGKNTQILTQLEIIEQRPTSHTYPSPIGGQNHYHKL